MKIIKWTNKSGREFEILVDEEDYERVSEYKWYVKVFGIKKSGEEYCLVVNNKVGYLHRFILNVTDSKIEVDHQNHNGLDNRKENLRPCTRSENELNKHKLSGTSSQYKGVGWHKGAQKWQCIACVNGKKKYLGRFTSEIAAAHAYDNYVKNLPDAEFRILNFSDKIS